MRALLLTIAVAMSATAAGAQSDPYRPFAIGDEWVFQTYFGTDSPFVSWPATGYSRYVVTRDTLADGVTYRVVDLSSIGRLGEVTPVCSAGVAYAADGTASVLRITGSATAAQCAANFTYPLSPPVVRTVSPGTYLVGDVPTTFATVRETEEAGATASGEQFYRSVWYAAGVGLIAAGQRETYRTNTIGFSKRLSYASVGGQVYGANPVAGEAPPPSAAAPRLRAYPSPATAFVTIASAERGAVDVFDALGRRVAAGEAAPGAPLRLNVSAWPPGVYVVRSDGAQTARFVVVR